MLTIRVQYTGTLGLVNFKPVYQRFNDLFHCVVFIVKKLIRSDFAGTAGLSFLLHKAQHGNHIRGLPLRGTHCQNPHLHYQG